MIRARAARAGLLSAAALLAGGSLALAAPGDLALVSVSSAGVQGATASEASAVSADGLFVAFTSASALTTTATGGKVQLYVRNRTTGVTTLASSSAAGAAAGADVDAQDVANVQFSISGDGRYVVFASTAANLTPADTDALQDVFRKDLVTGAVTLVSVNSAGAKANAAVFGDPDVSGDGNRVSFGSGAATNLFGADGNAAGSDVVVRDIAAGTTVLAAQTTAGAQSNGTTERSAISADGRAVAFEAPAGTTNLAPNDTGAANDVFVRNLAAGTLSAASDPTVTTGSGFPDISGDGRYAVIETGHKYDAVNDLSGGNDVYRRDMGTGAIVLISAKDASDAGGATDGVRPAISADGGRVAFTSGSADLVTGDANAVRDVFVRDVAARTTRLASVRADGTTQGTTAAEIPGIAADGGLVAFTWNDTGAATKLITADANAQPDILAKEFTPSDDAAPALTLTGPAQGSTVSSDQIAVGGTASDPSGIVAVTVNGVAVPVTATGGFSTAVAATVGTNAVTVSALDGAGNRNVVVRSVTRSAPVTTTPLKKARVLGLAATLTKAGRLRVTVRLSSDARVRVSLLRRTVRLTPRRVIVLRTAAPAVTRTLKAGRRTVVLTPPAPLRLGRYVVRVRLLSPAVGPATRNLALKVTRGR